MRHAPPSLRLRFAVACVAGLGALAPGAAFAITCTVNTTANVSFGGYDVFDTSPVLTTGTVVVHCTSVTGSDNITVDLSEGDGASFSPRTLSGAGSDTLNYNLYTNAVRTLVWGDGTSGTDHYGPANPPDDTDVPLSVYGRIPAGQSIPSGSYGDTIIVTVNF